jgi:ribosomal protein S12
MHYCYKWKGFVFVKFETKGKIPNFVLLKPCQIQLFLSHCKVVKWCVCEFCKQG